MSAGDYGEMLLKVAARLCEELGDPPDQSTSEVPDFAALPLSELGLSYGLDAEDRKIVESLRGALMKIAMALCPSPGEPAVAGVLASLDGAESMMGVELLRGHPEQLPKLMPGFVFLVALQVAGQDRALELSRRASELIEEAG